MKILQFPIIKLVICFTLGIYAGCLTDFDLIKSLITTSSLVVFLGLYTLWINHKYQKSVWFGLLLYVSVFFIGVLTLKSHNPKQYKSHYTHHVLGKNTSSIIFKVREKLKPSAYYNPYIVELLRVDSIAVTGKTILYVPKDSLQNSLFVDAVFGTKAELKPIYPPLNPGQFDYKTYLERQYVYHSFKVENSNLKPLDYKLHTIKGYANATRNYIENQLDKQPFSTEALAVLKALTLGQRQNLDATVIANYTKAGVIHILAVSGLHVGILLWVFTFLFNWVKRFKNGEIIHFIIILILLWSYAFLAGASASILRATTLFTVLHMATLLKRKKMIYNTLSISIFILLLVNPMFIFNVGFQMSYLAVFGIVAIYPLLFNSWKPKYKAINLLWQIQCVSVSAQLGVLPISLYYFHQFPGLFWLTNLIIMPFLGYILIYGILLIILSLLNIVPQVLVTIFNYVINAMNRIIEWIAKWDVFVITDIAIHELQVILVYLLIGFSIHFILKRNYIRLKLVLCSVILLQASCFYVWFSSNEDAFMVFHKTKETIISEKVGISLFVNSSIDSITRVNNNYALNAFVEKVKLDSLKPVYRFKNQSILIIDSTAVYNVKRFKPDVIVLTQSPKLNLERVIDSLKPKTIVADGSNYNSFVKQWETTCRAKKIPFHHTGKKGAFILKE